MVELERLSRDPAWLDKAMRIVDKLVLEANGNQKGKGPRRPLPPEVRLSIEPLHCRNGVRLVSFFVFLQGEDLHEGTFRVSAMHGFGVVPQSLLSEPLWVASRLGTSGTGVAVAVER